jgi:hypothetical protein
MAFNKNYLSSENQPWAREVQKRIENTEVRFSSAEVNNLTRDDQLASSLRQVQSASTAATTAANSALAAINGLTGLGQPGSEFPVNGANLTVGSVTANEINAAYVYAGNISADQINAGSLSADYISGGTIDGISITGGDLNTTSAGGLSVEISGSSASFKSGGSAVGQVSADGAGRLLVSGNSGLYLNGGASGSTHFGSGGFAVGDGADLTVQGTALINGSLTRTILANGGTTTASINNTGNFIRTSSSQRYKTDIQLLDINLNDLYAIQPKTFKRIDEVEQSPENARTYPGFIAEDLAGTSLDHFVFYSNDEDGNPRPEGIHYAELTGALLIAIKDLNARIEALEAK